MCVFQKEMELQVEFKWMGDKYTWKMIRKGTTITNAKFEEP